MPNTPTNVDKFFNFSVEGLNKLREEGKKQRHAIKDAKGITSDLIKVAKDVIKEAIEISKKGADNSAALIRSLRTDFRKDVFNILKAGADSLNDNFEEKFSNKWISEVTNNIDANENIYKNIMMERVAPVLKKVIGLMDPIQALNYTDDQKVELGIDAAVAIPSALFIASITMYSKSLPLVMRLTGLIPPTIIANFETTLSTIICIFNNFKRFQELEENNKGEAWKSYQTEPAEENKNDINVQYNKKTVAKGTQKFWQCDTEGLKLEDQNTREIDEQYRLIKAGQAKQKRKEDAKKMNEQIEKDNAKTEATQRGGETSNTL